MAGIFYVYHNLNQLLTNALNNGFNANIISDVYKLKFENLDVNIVTGSVKVFNVEMYPREKPLNVYSEINSSFKMTTGKMLLKNVDLIKLLRTNSLSLKKIELVEPGINFTIADSTPVFFPFKASPSTAAPKGDKKSIESYFLEEFSMTNAYFHVDNDARKREINIENINLSLKDILIDRKAGHDVISYAHFGFSIGELKGKLEEPKKRSIHFKNFNVTIDSHRLEETPDTIIYSFADVHTGIENLEIETADSLSHLSMESFKLNYKNKLLEFKNLSLRPNISDAAMQKRFTYRKEYFSVSIGTIQVIGFQFDSLLYGRKLFIDEVVLDSVDAKIYKDLTKSIPPNHRPVYLGQQIQSITKPITIKKIKATNVNLANIEVKPDGGIGKANLKRTTLIMENVTSLPSNGLLTISANTFVENEAHTYVTLAFNYAKPEFSIDGRIEPFDLTKLNALTNSYAPAKIKNGMSDGITFSGMVYENRSTGTMKFLYHDLVVDFELEDKAKWKSAFLGLAANTYLNASNPVGNLPPREVRFEVERDLRKGFLAMIIKSVLDGVKATFIMSKENKQAYREVKQDAKAEAKMTKKKNND